MNVRYRVYRAMSKLRCRTGIHRLRGYQDCGDGINVAPFAPRSRSAPNAWRVCTWCGAKWRGGSAEARGFWLRVPDPPAVSAVREHKEPE